MFKTHLEAMHLVQGLGHELAGVDFTAVEVAVCPPFTALRTVQTLLDSDRLPFSLGAQNMHFETEGAFTGEVAAPMLKSLQVKYVILGHSERREIFGETDEGVNAKVKAAYAHDLVPIVCCGETEEERDRGSTDTKVEGQIRTAFIGCSAERVRETVIAYEPIWAIGTGRTALPEDAQQTISFIREVVAQIFDPDLAEDVRILYGGSVKAGNAAALMRQPDIDGGLVGGASLEAGGFAAIVKATVPSDR